MKLSGQQHLRESILPHAGWAHRTTAADTRLMNARQGAYIHKRQQLTSENRVLSLNSDSAFLNDCVKTVCVGIAFRKSMLNHHPPHYHHRWRTEARCGTEKLVKEDGARQMLKAVNACRKILPKLNQFTAFLQVKMTLIQKHLGDQNNTLVHRATLQFSVIHASYGCLEL